MATYLEGTDAQKNRAYSPAVITEGGRVVWLAGQTATVDGDGKDISGNFEAQTHRVFALIDQTLRRVGGTLASRATATGSSSCASRSSPTGTIPGARSSPSPTSRGPAWRSRSRPSP